MGNELQREELEALILDNDLEGLEKELDRFNLFDVFRKTQDEKLHSSIIRWLLDPIETHGLKDYFLKKFLKKVLFSNKSHPYLNLSAIDIDVLDLDDSVVQTEEVYSNKKRGDISVNSETNKIYILIENKVTSKEGSGQTKQYVKEAVNRYPEHKRIFIYLTPDGEPAKSDEFLPFSYHDLKDVIEDVAQTKGREMSDDTKFLLSQLKGNVEVNILEESDIEKYCQKIYAKHKKALDKIFEYRPDNKQIYSSLGHSVVSNLKENWTYHATNTYCAIFRKNWRYTFNANQPVSFFHYEFNSVDSDKLTVAIHIEKWGSEEQKTRLKEELAKTDLINEKNVNLDRREILVRNSARSISGDIDNAIETGTKDMIKLISETCKYLDEASGRIKK